MHLLLQKNLVHETGGWLNVSIVGLDKVSSDPLTVGVWVWKKNYQKLVKTHEIPLCNMFNMFWNLLA